jgi:hypothetical protein
MALEGEVFRYHGRLIRLPDSPEGYKSAGSLTRLLILDFALTWQVAAIMKNFGTLSLLRNEWACLARNKGDTLWLASRR